MKLKVESRRLLTVVLGQDGKRRALARRIRSLLKRSVRVAKMPFEGEAGALHAQGQKQVWSGDHASALNTLYKAMKIDPQSAEIRTSLRAVVCADGLRITDEGMAHDLYEYFKDDEEIRRRIESIASLFSTPTTHAADTVVSVREKLSEMDTDEFVRNTIGNLATRGRLIGAHLEEVLERGCVDNVSDSSSQAVDWRLVQSAAKLLERLKSDEALANDFAEVVACDASLSVLQALAVPVTKSDSPWQGIDRRTLARAIMNYGSCGPAVTPRVAAAASYLKTVADQRPNDAMAGIDYARAAIRTTLGVSDTSQLRSGFIASPLQPHEAVAPLKKILDRNPGDPSAVFHMRQARRHAIPELPFVGFPRSGSVFVYTSLVTGLGKPGFGGVMGGAFPDFTIAQEGFIVMRSGRGSSHTHLRGSRVNLLEIGPRFDVKKMLVHVRDPRQALISWHHFMPKIAGELDPVQSKHYNLPDDYLSYSDAEQMNWLIDNWLPVLVTWLEEWKQASSLDWFKTEIHYSKFEDMKLDQAKFFEGILDFFEIDHDLFDMPVKPTREGDRNFRKGLINTWNSELNPEQLARVDQAVPKELLDFYGWDSQGLY